MSNQKPSVERRCGDCTLCCTLLPVKEIGKPATQKCQHQCSSGCRIYQNRPVSCMLWSCAWLTGEAKEARRPDRCGYVIDIMPDFVSVTNDGVSADVLVTQVWVDPKRPLAHRDPTLRAYIERTQRPAVVRYGNAPGNKFVFLVPPSLVKTEEWIEKEDEVNSQPEHTAAQVAEVRGRT